MDWGKFYGNLTGVLENLAGYPVQNAFDETCEQEYTKVMEAHQRICARLGGQEQEDSDVIDIMSAYEAIMERISKAAFQYGERHGRGEIAL